MVSYRLFDGRSKELGPYYVSFGHRCVPSELDIEHVLRKNAERHPVAILQYGLEQHARWKRTGDENARERFLSQARWAASSQREIAGVRGIYELPSSRSAVAQGEAISLLLRAYHESGSPWFLDRAIDAAIPLMVDLRDGGVLWQAGDDVIFQGVADIVPSHMLSGWISALWAMLELSRTAELDAIHQLYEKSLATLERYLPHYDSGTWSYDNLLATPSGFRSLATLRRHLLHVAQLDVLLSMTGSKLFATMAARWRSYSGSYGRRFQVWAGSLVPGLT